MISSTAALILLLAVGLFGVLLGYVLRFLQMTLAKAQLEVNVRKTLNKARSNAEAILAEAYEESSETRRELEDRLQQTADLQTELSTKQQALEDSLNKIEVKNDKLGKAISHYTDKLTEISRSNNISPTEIKQALEQQITIDVNDYYQEKIKNLEQNYKKELQELITTELPNITRRTVRNATSTTINISGDEIGKIIGRDGINIKSFERYAGVDLVVDDQENTVNISSFDPKRRFIAKQSLVTLLEDGRINRERIYDQVQTTESELQVESLALLDRGLTDLGLESSDILSVEIKQHLSELYWRHSYGQNQLEHSLEVADIARLLAKRIEPKLMEAATLAGLLHDIGKSSLESTDHVAAGLLLLQQIKLDPNVTMAIREHHNDHATNLLSAILQSADAISSGRPGARTQSVDTYIKWLSDVDNFIMNYEAVDNAYAFSGGREVQIMVKNKDYTKADLQQLGTILTRDLKAANLVHSPITLHLWREDEFTKKVA